MVREKILSSTRQAIILPYPHALLPATPCSRGYAKCLVFKKGYSIQKNVESTCPKVWQILPETPSITKTVVDLLLPSATCTCLKRQWKGLIILLVLYTQGFIVAIIYRAVGTNCLFILLLK